jgi:hypothetical protein
MAIQTTQVGNTATTVYTSSGDSAVTYVSFTNYTGSAVDIDVNVVPSGDSVGNVNTVIKTLTIDATDTYFMYSSGEKMLLGNADSIVATANTASAISSFISYTSI